MAFELDSVIAALDYDDPRNLLRRSSSTNATPSRQHAWEDAVTRVEADAAFFEGALPLVYFRGLSHPSESEIERRILEFHQRCWSQGRAPLVVVVLPDQIRVLDGLTPWDRRPELARAHGEQPVALALEAFRRLSVVSGEAHSALRPVPSRSPGE